MSLRTPRWWPVTSRDVIKEIGRRWRESGQRSREIDEELRRLVLEAEDDRPSWDDVHMTYALALSMRSTCARLQVGCVVTSWDNTRVLAMGYNGNYSGGPNECDSEQVGNCGCIHSEANAIAKLSYDSVKKRMYCTHLCCKMCSKLCIQAGMSEVVYVEDYRSLESLAVFAAAGVSTRKMARPDVALFTT